MKMLQIFKFFVIQSILTISSTGLDEVLFLIDSPNSSYHRQQSVQLRNSIRQQYKLLDPLNTPFSINVELLTELFDNSDDWTLLSAIPKLSAEHASIIGTHTKWIVWCEESTHVNVAALLWQLAKHNHSEPLFLSYALHDQEATIIHHFAFVDDPKWFPYPMLRAGVVFTITLYDRLRDVLHNEAQHLPMRRTHFTIDVAHELALLIYDNIRATASTTTTATPATIKASVQRTKDKDNKRMQGNKSINNANGTNGNVRDNNNNNNNNNNTIKSNSKSASVNANGDNGSNGELIRMQAVQGPATTTTTTTTGTTTTTRMLSSPSPSNVGVRKILLQHAPFICPRAEQRRTASQCAMHAKPMDLTTCIPIQRACIYFAIKTCQQFHMDRIPLLKSTWTPFAVHKKFYSDISDMRIPTVSTGVPNINGGHCAKTLAIFKLALKDIEQTNRQNAAAAAGAAVQRNKANIDDGGDGDGAGVDDGNGNVNVDAAATAIQWLFLADDDTLLSVARLTEFLGCFNASEAIYLGERYGYRLHATDGFTYITGGGGIVLSLPALRRVVRHCTCPTASAPDDMILGACMRSLQIKAVHTSRFHQTRSMDYAREMLELEAPITFHKFWQLDPLAEYEQWFRTADLQMLQAEVFSMRQQQRHVRSFRNVSQQHCYVNDNNNNNGVDQTLTHCCNPQQQQQQHRSGDEHKEL